LNRSIILGLALGFSSGAFATDTDAVVGCVDKLAARGYSGEAITTCRGVKTAGDIVTVVGCVDKMAARIYAVTACQGVKTAGDITAVLGCIYKLEARGYAGKEIPVCQGVKN
jgi:hypothetical protein